MAAAVPTATAAMAPPADNDRARRPPMAIALARTNPASARVTIIAAPVRIAAAQAA